MATPTTVSIDKVSESNSIKVQNLTCFRNEAPLFVPVTFTVSSGETLLITGPNGSGKTSLLRSLTGSSDLTDDQDWSIEWNNHDIGHFPDYFRQSMSYIGHQPGIKLELTVRENLETASAILGRKEKTTIIQAINAIGLSARADTPVQNLSAGQRKRASLCRLLLFNSPLWILDEPQASLDVQGMRLLEKMIVDHLESDGLLIITTHQQINLPESRTTTLGLETL